MPARATIPMNVQIRGTLDYFWGATPEPLPDSQASIQLALHGYGSQIPRVPGQGMFQDATSFDIAMQGGSESGDFSIAVYSNDLIQPPGTYYTLTVKNYNGDILQVNAYHFLGSGNWEISTLEPYDPNQTPPPLPPLITNQLLIVPFSPTPDFPGDTYTTWSFTLAGDIETSTTSGLVPGNLYTFIIQQNSTGGFEFTWPPNVFNGTVISPVPGSMTIQTFVCDGVDDLYAIGGGTFWP